MNDNSQYFIDRIGMGVAEAFATCKFFLGLETEAFENADIHPEYVTTVEVAKKLTDWDRYVSLETHMKDLRGQAGRLARMRSIGNPQAWKMITDTLGQYKFGVKDSWRIDIMVRPSDEQKPPLLLAEAKLGVGKVRGIIQDIDRIMQLLRMYHQLKLLDDHPVYGAVLFHSFMEGGDAQAADRAAQRLLDEVNKYLSLLTSENNWLHAKAGLLSTHALHQPVQGYCEKYSEEDGSDEYVFAKKSFTFAPGVVFFSHRSDVDDVKF